MQNGYVLKSALMPDKADLEKINAYTRRPFGAEEVYTFRLVLCDNEIDRDGERFSTAALEGLAKLFLGKTGLFNHSMDARTQSARIYDTQVESDPGRRTGAGELYSRLTAKAYMPRTPGNADFIVEIDSGIKKEVSVGCAMGSAVCSICGADRREHPCGHENGKIYAGKTCCTVLSDPRDAYEWSFVAVPAQREAGVTKSYTEKTESGPDDAAWGRRYKETLRQQTAKALSLACPGLSGEAARKMAAGLSPEELQAAHKSLFREANRRLPLSLQLAPTEAPPAQDDEFRI
ncbi:MAG: hypothetical protein LKE53_09285 [Oscillospiraceae bacterium]|jgi:hypothetical protein|nr:hypothetical protein [Oscillospiraceae bacterium]MDD3260443.1 hypothetical protein [Oscillospiraceae bacterium]